MSWNPPSARSRILRSHDAEHSAKLLSWTRCLRRPHQEGRISDRPSGGARRDRTDDLMLAKHALSQLSYGPLLDKEFAQNCAARSRACGLRPNSPDDARGVARPNGRRARLRESQGRGGGRRRLRLNKMVGLGRLELPTSRLSSARSNQLSYKPEPDAPITTRDRVGPIETGENSSGKKEKRRRRQVPHVRPDWPIVLKRSEMEANGEPFETNKGTSLERR